MTGQGLWIAEKVERRKQIEGREGRRKGIEEEDHREPVKILKKKNVVNMSKLKMSFEHPCSKSSLLERLKIQ